MTGADITNGRIARDLDVVGALMILLQRGRAERNLAGLRALIAFSGYRGGQLIALGRHRGQDRAALGQPHHSQVIQAFAPVDDRAHGRS